MVSSPLSAVFLLICWIKQGLSVVQLDQLDSAHAKTLSGNVVPFTGALLDASMDFDGDGLNDILIAADFQGAYLFYGTTSGAAFPADLTSMTAEQGFWAHASDEIYAQRFIGDVDGDGKADLLFGLPNGDGQCILIFGSDDADADYQIDGLSSPFFHGAIIYGPSGAGSAFGIAVGPAGDINQDGFADFLISAAAAVYLVYGQTLPSLTVPIESLSKVTLSGFTGSLPVVITTCLRSAGDVDKDGKPDFLFCGGSSAYLIYGSSSLPATINVANAAALSNYGRSFAVSSDYATVSGAGDYNGDGYADFLLGGITSPDEAIGNNTVYLIYGASRSSLSAVNLNNLAAGKAGTVIITSSKDVAGFAMDSVGDLNNDGFDEILIGGPAYGPEAASGRTYLIYGTDTYQSTINAWSLTPGQGLIFEDSRGHALSGFAVSVANGVTSPTSKALLIGEPLFGTAYLVNDVWGPRDTLSPISYPSSKPSGQPSLRPSGKPSDQPSSKPTGQPIGGPTGHPSSQPSTKPTLLPSSLPSADPSSQPTVVPSANPSGSPSLVPSSQPSGVPTTNPTSQPTREPTGQPTIVPSAKPSESPSSQPSARPSTQPTSVPTGQPSINPSAKPSGQPSSVPTGLPTGRPSAQPTDQPSGQPSAEPSGQPTSKPSGQPSMYPSGQPSRQPTRVPTSQPTDRPSAQPTDQPSGQPSTQPSGQPTSKPTSQPSEKPSGQPTRQPTRSPTRQPTGQPSVIPSSQPSAQPFSKPTGRPSAQPSGTPTAVPSVVPSAAPSGPTQAPTSQITPYIQLKVNLFLVVYHIDSVSQLTLQATHTILATISKLYGVTLSDVELKSIIEGRRSSTTGNARRMLILLESRAKEQKQQSANLTAAGELNVTVSYSIKFNMVDYPGYNESALIELKSKQIVSSATNGEFQTLLRYYAFANQADQLTGVVVNSAEIASVETTYPPTNDNGLSDGTIAGIVVGSVFGFVLLVALVFMMLKSRRNGRKLTPVHSAVSISRQVAVMQRQEIIV